MVLVAGDKVNELMLSDEDKEKLIKGIIYERKSVKIVYEILTHYSCEQCGKCCAWSDICVTEEEYKQMSKLDEHISDKVSVKGIHMCLSSPCPYLIKGKECGINDMKPFVCKVYPFSYAYGLIVSLIRCPLGDKIIKDVYEYSKTIKIENDESVVKSYGSLINSVNEDNKAMGINGGKPLDSLLMTYPTLFGFAGFVRMKYRKVKL